MDFLFENSLNDSKAWFDGHKADYKRYVTEPFAELVNRLSQTMLGIDDKFICDPRKISRIYRDARYSKGKSIFRDYVWYTFSRTRDAYRSLPGFYFSISPRGFDYGCGYYYAASATMQAMRELIINGDKSFVKALKAFEDQNVFELYGDMYKRGKYPDESEKKRNWLERKNIGLSCESKDFKLLFSDKLTEKVAADFKAVAPVYEFFMLADEKAKQG